MAASLITRAGRLAQRFYGKAIEAGAIGLTIDGSSRTRPEALIVVSAGAGAPTEAATNGSLYLRTNGTDGDNSAGPRRAGCTGACTLRVAYLPRFCSYHTR